jgi:hypothetical protein
MLEHSIDHIHRQAEAMERDARQVDERLARLGLPDSWINRARGLGELRNPYGQRFSNLTVRGILEQKDRSLAYWLAQREGATISGVDYQAQQRAEQQAAAAARMQEQTEALRARNHAVQKQREHERTYGRMSHGRLV